MSDNEPIELQASLADPAVGHAPSSEIVRAELVEAPPPSRLKIRRRVLLPLALFLLTCSSTFFAGATGWQPPERLFNTLPLGSMPDPYFMLPVRLLIVDHWQQGLLYMGCVLAILLMHEMGHFIMTVIYHVRASLPYFIPLPFLSPIGTMGAVIGMDGSQADRRQIFDIGLAGPLAGLVVAIPIIWIGTQQLDLSQSSAESFRLELPLAMRLLVDYMHPGAYNPRIGIGVDQLNAYFMAGWVGLLVTGLNMMPVSQLDGGHVTYALFGRAAHWFARLFMIGVFIYMGAMFYFFNAFPMWLIMALLVLMIGTDHPPTRDDSVRLGWFRGVLGAASLLIPVFCFIPNPINH